MFAAETAFVSQAVATMAGAVQQITTSSHHASKHSKSDAGRQQKRERLRVQRIAVVDAVLACASQLWRVNVLRLRGPLVRCLCWGMMAHPKSREALVLLASILQIHIPVIGRLFVVRVVHQFVTARQQRQREAWAAAADTLGYMVNFGMVDVRLGIDVLRALLHPPTATKASLFDACAFLFRCGVTLYRKAAQDVVPLMDQLRRVDTSASLSTLANPALMAKISALCAQFKSKFYGKASVPPELDLVYDEDMITHRDVSLEAQDPQASLDHANAFTDAEKRQLDDTFASVKASMFSGEDIIDHTLTEPPPSKIVEDNGIGKQDPPFTTATHDDDDNNKATSAETKKKKKKKSKKKKSKKKSKKKKSKKKSGKARKRKRSRSHDDSEDSDSEEMDDAVKRSKPTTGTSTSATTSATTINDQTGQDVVEFKTLVYLTMRSSLRSEECAHKFLEMGTKGKEMSLAGMIVECCAVEPTYSAFFGGLAAHLCGATGGEAFVLAFDAMFAQWYAIAHRLDANKLRNVALLFAHLLQSGSMPYQVLYHVRLNPDDTTPSSRIFLKILLESLAEYMGGKALAEKLLSPSLAPALTGLLPTSNMRDTAYAMKFFANIGLTELSVGLRPALLRMRDEALANPASLLQQPQSDSSDSDSSDSDSSDSDSSDSSSSDSSDSSSSSSSDSSSSSSSDSSSSSSSDSSSSSSSDSSSSSSSDSSSSDSSSES